MPNKSVESYKLSRADAPPFEPRALRSESTRVPCMFLFSQEVRRSHKPLKSEWAGKSMSVSSDRVRDMLDSHGRGGSRQLHHDKTAYVANSNRQARPERRFRDSQPRFGSVFRDTPAEE
jgi:hypothetical protein